MTDGAKPYLGNASIKLAPVMSRDERLALAVPTAFSRWWKPYFRRLSNDLIAEMAISESPCREIRQNGKRSVGFYKTNVKWNS